MPPKHTILSSSKDIVPKGPREVFKNSDKSKDKLKRPQRETTSRALVLRNGKHGARGTGEIMLASRMTGREKLDLLAEDLVEKSKRAVLRPFRLEECLKIAKSQCDVYIDDIANLRDADFFYHVVEAELVAKNSPNRETVRKNPSYVAKVVATRLHNSYMLASAWKIVSETLNNFAINGIGDDNIKGKLTSDSIMRDRYLLLTDMVNTLVELSQNRFSVLATTTPHYSRYFKIRPTEGVQPGETEYIFDWKDLRQAANSFIDSIIIELCFPRGIYPETILYQLLHDAIAECPKGAKRFPQALWDSIGDLSVSVKLKDLLDVPLFGPDGEKWRKQPRKMTQEYEDWVDAQFHSRQASDMFAAFKDVIFPLEKTRKQHNLDEMWKTINSNYRSSSGKNIDDLWNLTDNFNSTPQWTSIFLPGMVQGSNKGSGPDSTRSKRKEQKKLLRVTNGDDLLTDPDMPALQSASDDNARDDDDDDESQDDEDDDDDDDDDDDGDDEGGYNTEEEDEIRELVREAMDIVHESDWLSGSDLPKDVDPFEGDRKGNPFLKLLGSLRGRMFSSSPKLAQTGVRQTPTSRSKPIPSTVKPNLSSTPQIPTAPAPVREGPTKSRNATVEDVSDQDDHVAPKKKKKKPKKKKKTVPVPSSVEPTSPTEVTLPSSPPASPKAAPISKSTLPKSPDLKTASFTAPPVAVGPTTAQSGHSYWQSLAFNKSDKKTKSRPDHASSLNPETEENGLKSNSSFPVDNKSQEVKTKEAKKSWFSKLRRKTNDLMHQLLRKSEKAGGMKWDDFVLLMKDMGFTYVPSTAGSSVRFDPPCEGDPPITFHKGHPDPTLKGVVLKKIATRLKRKYGWDESDLAV